jgi:adenylate kinase
VVKVVLQADGLALYFSRAPIPWWRDGFAQGVGALPQPAPLRHIGIYGYRAGFLREFPRMPQAPVESCEALEHVVEIALDDALIVERMSGRRVHLPSGRTYHLKFNPPKAAGRDDATGEELIQREDDREETVRKRLEIYHRQTEPLVDYYRRWAESREPGAPRYHRIDGFGRVEQVRDRIFAALG